MTASAEASAAAAALDAYWLRKAVECQTCHKMTPLVALGMCSRCYQRQHRLAAARAKDVCPAHHRQRPCDPCARSSATQRLRWQDGDRRRRHAEHMSTREGAWNDDETQIIRRLAGSRSSADITRQVNQWRARFKLVPRTVGAVRTWAENNGVCLQRELHSVTETSALLGIHCNTVHTWVRAGYLVGEPWGKFWVFTDAELQALVRTYPWFLDVDDMAAGPLRDLAAHVNRRDPWIRARDLARMVPCRVDTMRVLIRAGLIEARQRTGHNAPLMVRTSVLRDVRELLVTRRRAATEKLIEFRRSSRQENAA